MNKKLQDLNRNQIKEYLYNVQLKAQKEMSNYDNVDDFLDNTNIFDEFEEILPDQEFGVLMLTILNNFKSEIILNDLLDIVEYAIEKK